MTARFRFLHRKTLPSWLSTGEGDLHGYAVRIMLDCAAQRMKEAAYARFPEYAPADALPYQARDRKIPRGIDEQADVYATRLLTWLDDHKRRGNPFKLCAMLAAYCNAAVRVRTVDQRGNWFSRDRDGTESLVLDTGNWDWATAYTDAAWGRFWVIIYPTSEGQPWTVGPRWGDAGAVYGTDRTWGTSATPGQVAAVRSIVREWKPAGTRCENIVIAFDDASFDPTAPEPDGSWLSWSKGDPVVKNRLATARYWKGTGP
jgi:hypothetical protein